MLLTSIMISILAIFCLLFIHFSYKDKVLLITIWEVEGNVSQKSPKASMSRSRGGYEEYGHVPKGHMV